MGAITISRQIGSLGRKVADEVANQLGYRVVWREVINQAASRARVPEVALATIDELNLLGLKPALKDIQAYQAAVQEVMHELVTEDNVIIVGRAGQVILGGVVGVLHVRIFAPIELRVQRVAEQQGIGIEAARAQVETSDQSRVRYLRRYYSVRWDAPDLYDLMINTAHLSPTCAAAVICEALSQKLSQKVSKG